MRSRHALVAATTAVVTAVLGQGGAAASVASSPPRAAAATAPVQQVGTDHAVTLVTGQRVTARTVGGTTRYAVQRTGTASGSEIVSFTLRGRTFLVPATATAYLGRVLDPSLFDVTTLSGATDPARMQIRIAHTGATPTLPGVTVTGDRAGVATGYLTATSAAAFGTALTAQWWSDHGRGSSSLFAGISSIAAADAAPPIVTPTFPMKTLIVHAVDVTGAPEDTGGLLMNVDDGAKYVGFLSIVGGEARVSVPVGDYAGAVFDSSVAPDGSIVSRLVIVDGFSVTTNGQVLTFDAATATSQLAVTLPRPSALTVLDATWARTDAAGSSLIAVGTEAIAPDRVFVTPTSAVSVGSQHYLAAMTARQRGLDDPKPSAYTYDLAYPADHVPASQVLAPKAKDLATVTASYDTDQAGRQGNEARWLSDIAGAWVSLWPLALPQTRTEYVGGPSDAQWYEEMLGNSAADDPGFIDGGPYVLAAGTSVAHTWARGPLGAGIAVIPPAAESGLCYACRTATEMQLGMAPLLDSQADHVGSIYGSPDGTPVAHVRIDRDGQVLADSDDALGAYLTVPKANGRYTMALDVNRYWTASTLSTRSHTEVSFLSHANAGPAAPASWYCDGCRVLPVLQAKVSYPVSQTGDVTTGTSTFSVTAERIQGALRSTVVSASLWLRPSGWGWVEFPMTKGAGGRWVASIDLPDYLTGDTVDVRVQAADAGGSTVDQTVERAFRLVAGGGAAARSGSAPLASPTSTAWASVRPAASAATTAGATASAGTTASAAMTASAATTSATHRACATAEAGSVRCLSLWRSGAGAGPRARVSGAAGDAVGDPAQGYGPSDIAAAYGLTGAQPGTTVAIVDAYDDPNVESDLAAYRAAWGLPACTTANGCFHKINQRGGTTPPAGDPGWGVEISLDVQAVSAACPSCKILLVEADSATLDDIGVAVNRAVKRGAKVVSNSYGADEFTGMDAYATAYYTHPGVAQVFSSGDYGFMAASFPAVLPNAIAVGGTSLTHDASGWSEAAWWGAGSGCSAWVDKPTWQRDKHCDMRTVADLSAVADPDTGLAVYDTYGLGADNGWIVVGGTSLSAPLISGMIARAGNPQKLASAKYIYTHRSGLADVVGGSNGYCGNDYLCTAKKGYDGPTGLGSPRGLSAL